MQGVAEQLARMLDRIFYSSPPTIHPITLDRNTTNEQGRQFPLASSGYGETCCPPVVDPYTWLALISGIALATYFLRITITTTLKKRRRKKRGADESIDDLNLVLSGDFL